MPLAGANAFQFDFGAVYKHTFASARFYRLVVDYEQDPPHFERYATPDRERLNTWLAVIRTQYHKEEGIQ